MSALARRSSIAPIRVYQRVDLAAAAAALQVRADVLALRRAGDRGVRHTARAGARGLAAAALQPVEPRRLRPRRRPARSSVRADRPRRAPEPRRSDPQLMLILFANVLQPLIDVFEPVLLFFHDTSGVGWGLVDHRADDLGPRRAAAADAQAVQVDAALQRLAPEIKAIQEKYKDDKQRQQQEMMKFYQENKVNPLASCLPLLFQLPVFISLFYMLRTDLKMDICPGIDGYAASPAHERHARHLLAVRRLGVRGRAPHHGRRPELPLHPGPDRQGDRRGAGRADRALRREPARVGPAELGRRWTETSG